MTIKGKLELVYEFSDNRQPDKDIIASYHNKKHSRGDLGFGENALSLIIDRDTILNEFEEILDTNSEDIADIAEKLVKRLEEIINEEFLEVTNKYFPEEEVIARLV